MAQEQTTQTIFQWTDEEKAVSSPEQIEICEMKILGEFQSKIMKKFQLSSLSNITTAISCTINGNIWKPGTNLGGRNPLLNDVDTLIFTKEIKARGYDLNCLSSKEGIALIYEL